MHVLCWMATEWISECLKWCEGGKKMGEIIKNDELLAQDYQSIFFNKLNNFGENITFDIHKTNLSGINNICVFLNEYKKFSNQYKRILDEDAKRISQVGNDYLEFDKQIAEKM